MHFCQSFFSNLFFVSKHIGDFPLFSGVVVNLKSDGMSFGEYFMEGILDMEMCECFGYLASRIRKIAVLYPWHEILSKTRIALVSA
mmetsp:Transcript_10551/g.15339  ORF Transcript_10551/g.15339 Transcript_10551/m.15339 type:complete len:86 (+) Transcript_10551:629-886(+)